MAYKGKFSPENRTPRFADVEIPKSAPRRSPAPVKEPQKAAEQPRRTAPAKQAPNAAPAKQPQRTAPQTAQPRRDTAPRKSAKRKSGSNIGSVIFYTIYFILVVAIVGGLLFTNNWLTGWLENYELAQPTTKCDEVFNQYFADPDWAALYEMAGIADTLYEGSDAFVSYMNGKVTGEITYVETSAGLSGGHKYLLKHADEVLGYFTLVDNAPKDAELPDWQFGQVSLNYAYNQSVSVQKMADQIVYVNGVALTDDHTIQIGTTLAENYLSNGIHGPQIHTQYLDGLMQEPTVTATDSEGNALNVTYNAESDLYVVQTALNTMSQDELDRAMGTAKTYALRMIEMVSKNELAKYFDTNSQSYKTIVSIDPWMQEWFFSSYEFANEAVDGFYRYTDDLFSVHVRLSMFVTRTDATVKEYTVDHTFFFEKQGSTWKCVNMVNVDVSQQIAEVRLTFMSGETILSNLFYADDITSLVVPVLSAPDGQIFAGWCREDVDESGKTVLTLVFTPDSDGNVTLPAGNVLEPMTLYPLFENAEANEGGSE